MTSWLVPAVLASLAWCLPCAAQQPYVFERSVDGIAEPIEVGFDAQGRLLVAAGPTVVSVGHRPSLRAFHHGELALDSAGGWRLEPIPPA